MSRNEMFLASIDKLNQVANDSSNHHADRIHALCEMYFLYQQDVHNQAKCVRRIQDINNKI